MRRILQLIETTGPGGAETVFLSLVSDLDPERWEGVGVVQGGGWVADSLLARGHSPIVLASTRRFDVPYLLKLRSLILERGAHIVHAHLASTGFYGSLAAALARVPSVVTFHGLPDLQVDRVKRSAIGSLSSRQVFVSKSLRDRAITERLYPEHSAVVISNGIDTERFKPAPDTGLRKVLGARPGQALVGAIGNVRPLKDYPTLLRTAASVQRRAPDRCRFVIVGATDSPIYPELLDLRTELGLEAHVEFAGFRNDIEEVLRALDVLLVTSSSEGFSLVTVQAMATEIPVVATRSGGPEEILRDDENGFLRAVGDADGLADAVLTLVDDSEKAAEMGRRGRSRARAEFSLEAMIKEYQALYDGVIGTSPGVR